MGYYDEDGKIYVCDRIMNTARVNGFIIYLTEIENVLQSHPAVFEVAVVSVLDDNVDERPFAFVSKIPDAEVRNWSKSRENINCQFYLFQKIVKKI